MREQLPSDIGSNAWDYDKWIYETLNDASIKKAYSGRGVARISQTSKTDTYAAIVTIVAKPFILDVCRCPG